MAFARRKTIAVLLAAPLLVSCGGGSSPGQRWPASPRALAAVVIEHVDGRAHRVEGHWSEYGSPLSLSAEVDYGVNPEGGLPGAVETVRVTVSDIARFSAKDRRFFACAASESEKCERKTIGGATVLYRWYHGAEEEEPGNYTWTVVRKNEVVRVEYEPSGYFDVDPRTLKLPIDPEDLRAAALDPAMSLRTTTEAVRKGRALKNYEGDEKPPIKPVVTPITRAQLLKNVQVELRKHATSSRPSTLTAFGLKPISVHLELAGSATYDPVSADIFTAVGRTPLVTPPPCAVKQLHDRARTHCYAVDRNSYTFWDPARGGRPGVLWIVAVRYDDRIKRPVSAAIRFESTGLTDDFFLEDRGKVRFSRTLREDAHRLVENLSPVQVRVR